MRSAPELPYRVGRVPQQFPAICFGLGLTVALALTAFGQLPAVTYSTIKAPGAGTKSGQGTKALSINDSGATTGLYINKGSFAQGTGVFHGFIRSAGGVYITFNIPGAGSKAGQGTEPVAINAGGIVTGVFFDSNSVKHCFLRQVSGAITIVNLAGAGTGIGQGTGCAAINKQGTVAGSFIDAAGTSHGFKRTASGSTSVFDVAGASTGDGSGTVPTSINDSGTVAGFFVNGEGAHGFVRNSSGTITKFDPPGSAGPTGGTTVTSINASGTTAGYFNNDGGPTHGFVRAANGGFKVFQVGVVDFVFSINNAGATSGGTITLSSNFGFIRTSSGVVTKFVPPTCAIHMDLEAFHINLTGDVVGYCQTSAGVYHGFLRLP